MRKKDVNAYVSGEGYFVYMDILGFKNVVNNNIQDKLREIVTDFFGKFNQAVHQSRIIGCKTLKGKKKNIQIDISEINFRLISDSILMWTTNSEHRIFRNLLEAVSELLACGLENGFPLRGAMTYGELIFKKKDCVDNAFFTNDAVYGKALVEAYTLEADQEWSGCIISPSAWKQICAKWDKTHTNGQPPEGYFNRFPLLTWYPIPLKSGNKEGIAINWNSPLAWDKEKIVNSNLVTNSFQSHGKVFLATNPKLDATLKYLNYTSELIKYYFCTDIRVARERQKTIPIPPADYSH